MHSSSVAICPCLIKDAESMTAEGGICGTIPLPPSTIALAGISDVNAPWAVSIGDVGDGSLPYQHNCGGSIIGLNVVLTAAHCITNGDFFSDFFVVVAGVPNLRYADKTEKFKIDKAVLHPRWQKEDIHHVYYDAGLIFTKEKFKYSPWIQPVCLPSMGHKQLVGESVTVVGWGRGHQDEHSSKLVQIDVTLRSDEECDYKYNQSTTSTQRSQIKNELPRLIEPTQFCADNNVKSDVGTCNGDSGNVSIPHSVHDFFAIRWSWVHKNVHEWGRPFHNLGNSFGKSEWFQVWR